MQACGAFLIPKIAGGRKDVMCFIWVAEQPLVRVEHLENCLTMVSELPECGLLIYGQAENQCCSNYTKGVDADSKMLAWQEQDPVFAD